MAGVGGFNPYYSYAPQHSTMNTSQNWSQYYSQDGVSYYYNATTGETSYEAPKAGPDDAPAWAEFKEENSGKKYYYNRLTKQCVWEEPEELRVIKAREEAKKLGFHAVGANGTLNQKSDQATDAENQDGAKASADGKNSMADDVNLWETLSKKEATQQFKELLLEKKVSSVTKWPEAMRLIANDNRWGCFRTLGERKQAFAEYQTQRSKEEKIEKREKTKTAREEFMKMLAACEKINSRSRWRDAVEILSQNPSFQAVESPHDREDLFMNFVTELGRTEREYCRKERQEMKEAYRQLLNEFKEKVISYRWGEMEKLEAFTQDPRYKKVVEANDRFHWFDDYVVELRAAEQEQRRKEREEEKAKERELIMAFRSHIQELIEAGKINALSQWKNILPHFQGHESYQNLVKNSKGEGLARHEMEQILDSLYATFKKQKYAFMDILKEEQFHLNQDITFEEFVKVLLLGEQKKGSREITQILSKHLDNAKLIFNDLIEREIIRKKEEDRRLKAKQEAFSALLTEYYYRSDHVGITWETAKEDMRHRTAFKALEENICQSLFNSYMAVLLAKKEARTKSVKQYEKEEQDELKKKLSNTSVSKGKKSRRRRRSDSESSSSSSCSSESEDNKSPRPSLDQSAVSKKEKTSDKKHKKKEKVHRKRSRKRSVSDSEDVKDKKKLKHKKIAKRRRRKSVSSVEEGRILSPK